jgi:hypothetical protein
LACGSGRRSRRRFARPSSCRSSQSAWLRRQAISMWPPRDVQHRPGPDGCGGAIQMDVVSMACLIHRSPPPGFPWPNCPSSGRWW